jgi:hypothetical protein
VYVYYDFALQGRRFRDIYTGVLGLGLITVHVYDDFELQGVRLRVVKKGVLGLGLTMVHLYYDFVLQGMSFRVILTTSTRFRIDMCIMSLLCRVGGLGLFTREY